MTIKVLLISILSVLLSTVVAQSTSFKTLKFNSTRISPIETDQTSFDVSIINLEKPSPNGNSYKSFLMNQKIKSRSKFPYKSNNNNSYKKNDIENSTAPPEVLKSYGMMQINFSGDTVPIYGGLPNDNSMAISNDGLLLLAVNSKVQLIDTKSDSILYPNEFINLRNLFGLPFGNYFDPKIIYDKDMDRFILVFLKNNNPASNLVIIGFSKTNNPIDGWNVYSIPGNPLNNNRWTDFPTIALSDSSLYFTGNLIIPNVSWQIGFDGSILWEMNKFHGFNDSTDIEPKLFYDIKFNNNYIRNLHAVQGADGNVKELTMLSNRNFDIQNDTFFLVSLKEKLDTNEIVVKEILADNKYGVPPNGRQQDTNLSDPTEGLQTNDARVLGAIQFNDQIQFVSTTINTKTGFAAIYHGVISNLEGNPSITSNIIADELKDLAYPNIAWSGNEDCDRETIIAFNHTSIDDFAGISSVYYSNTSEYSKILELKKGEGIVNRLPAGYERWGDYFGLQRKYNETGIVFSFGFTSDVLERNYGWVNELKSPDNDTLHYTHQIVSNGDYCGKQIEVKGFGGVPPYSVEWLIANNNSLISPELCNGDTVVFVLSDSRNCTLADTIIIEIKKIQSEFVLFPNPTSDILAFQFEATKQTEIYVDIYNTKGSFIKRIANQNIKKGLNEISFSTEPLLKGNYYLKISDNNNKTLFKEKFVKK